MGARIEQKQSVINRAQYGGENPALPPADYKLAEHLDDSTVYTFCMCPGGHVVAAASEHGRIVTNGMSNADREGENANAALLVTVNPADFPYEDSQFEVVLLEGSAVSTITVREAHRVLRPDGRLFFIVPEKTRQQDGFALPDVYSIVRDGFNIIETERPPWWLFGCRGHTLTITARKKTWKSYKGLGCRNLSYHSLFASTK